MHSLRIPQFLTAGALGIFCLGFTTSCQDVNTGSGAAIGAAIGGLFGAVVNDDNDNDEILKGAAIGAGIGALIGNAQKAKRYQGVGGTPTSGGQGYTTGTPTSNPNFVKSPYPPYNVIDVTGFRSGELAIDPTTNQVFRVP